MKKKTTEWLKCKRCGIKFKGKVCPNCIIKRLSKLDHVGLPLKNGTILNKPVTDWTGIKQAKANQK